RAVGRRAQKCPSTALALVVASFLWPPATLIIHQIAQDGITSLIGPGHLALFEKRMLVAALSIVALNPLVTLIGVPVLFMYYTYLKNNRQFPLATVYIAFPSALALQGALYWRMGIH